jgi:hypothetical protein
MKKYVWLLVAAAFAVAVFAMVGCRPAETPTPSPSPTPQLTPTPDTRCPQPVSTVVRNLYNPITGEGDPGKVEIVITFDEPIAGDVDCIENPLYWTVTVKNDTRYGEAEVTVGEVTLSADGKKITITATVTEDFDNNGEPDFSGLICDEDSAKDYRNALDGDEDDKDGKAPDGSSVSKYAKVADLVHWKLSAWCTVYDDLGNTCCGFEGEACCSPVCETVTPPSGCPL